MHHNGGGGGYLGDSLVLELLGELLEGGRWLELLGERLEGR